MRNIVFLSILSICIFGIFFSPSIVDGQINNGDLECTTELINDLKVRSIILNKKGIFYQLGDAHWFKVSLKQDVEYKARIKFTEVYGGTFWILLHGVTTSESDIITLVSSETNYVLEVVYVADGTTTGEIQLGYSASAMPENPTYTLYFNKTGFAGWWWIALSGLGTLAVLIVVFSFMIIGMISVTRRKKKGKKRKRK